jgi:hypothetical protein
MPKSSTGLVAGHAYSLIAVKQVGSSVNHSVFEQGIVNVWSIQCGTATKWSSVSLPSKPMGPI